MGGFLYVRKAAGETFEGVEKDYRLSLKVFEKQGLSLRETIDREQFTVFVFGKVYLDNSNACFFGNNDFAIATGTFFYKRMMGQEALKELYKDFTEEAAVFPDLCGHYGVMLFKEGRLYLFNDFGGLYHIFHNDEKTVIATSFLAVVKSLPKRIIAEQEFFEYVAQGATYNDNTYIQGVRLLDNQHIHRLRPRCDTPNTLNTPNTLKKVMPLPQFEADLPFEEQLDFYARLMLDMFRMFKSNVGDSICSALTGGFDTRLLLACMRNVRIKPRLYVYGGAIADLAAGFMGLSVQSSDPLFAKRIADGEGMTIEQYDKDAHPRVAPEDYPEVVSERFYLLDARFANGVIDNGSDIYTRRKRSSSAQLQLNGGAGQMLRDVWLLPGRTMPLSLYLKGAYADYCADLDYSIYTERFDRKRYFDSLKSKFQKLLGLSTDSITRQEVELVQPLIHNKYWMGQNNSGNNRLSYALTPCAEPVFNLLSARIPWQYKCYGRFEAALIRRLDERLASYPSRHGRNFMREEPLHRKMLNFALMNAPLTPRPFVLRQAHRLRHLGGMPYFLTDRYLSRIFHLKDLEISRYVKLDKIRHPRLLNRALTVELALTDRF